MKNNYISGFTIVRNAEILGYPFLESVQSILPLCDEFIINLGDSSDITAQIIKQIKKSHPAKVIVLPTCWNTQNQNGGSQLKRQTDFALEKCRGDWCFYLQADEVVHEQDYDKIFSAMDIANSHNDIDGIVFDYLHFYGNYHYTIRGRNWYRHEVRLFKNHRGIKAFRDAQGFRKQDARKLRAIASSARIFHYGYVRTPALYEAKSREMSQWWGAKPDNDPDRLRPRRDIGIRKFTATHPQIMATRIKSMNPPFDPEACTRRWDKQQIKNALTLLWESIFRVRIGEFTNYRLVRVCQKIT